MKITKRLLESRIMEDGNDDVSVTDLDPRTAPIDKIADGVQNDLAAETKDGSTVTDAAASAEAQEIKKVANEVNADKAIALPEEEKEYINEYVTENRLTKILDEALDNAQYYLDYEMKNTTNVLVSGLPGSGKTAIVEDWAKRKKVFFYPINAKNSKLEVAIDGMPMRLTDPATGQLTDKIAFLPVTLLQPILDHKNVIVFLDEYNRQTDPQVRGALLTLINEKRTAGGEMNFRENLLFTIACINPGGRKTDKGAAQLNDAERSRFIHQVMEFDSDPDTFLNFLLTDTANSLRAVGVDVPEVKGLKHHNGKVKPIDLSAKAKATINRDQRIKDIIMVYALGSYIVDNSLHPMEEFKFDEDDPDYLDQLNVDQKVLLNSRLLTDALWNARGNPEKFLNWAENASNMSDRDIKMFQDIINNMPDDWADAAFAAFGLAQSKANAGNGGAAGGDDDGTEDDATLDDDMKAAGIIVDGAGKSGGKSAEDELIDLVGRFSQEIQ